MDRLKLTLLYFFIFLTVPLWSQQLSFQGKGKKKSNHLMILDDAQLDIGLKLVTVFALDDRAPLSSNPHFRAMWNLIQLGATLESLLQGEEDPINDIDLSREFGQNGYNKSVFALYLRYGFGESSDLQLQRHFLELGFSSGYFKQGSGGMNIYLDYQFNLFKTEYGAGASSIAQSIDYELFLGARLGFDWSAIRTESEAGFFSHLTEEIERIAEDNEFTVAQLLKLKDLAETSKILLPESVGGRAFHIGPMIGGRLSKSVFDNFRVFLTGTFFYDMMDLDNDNPDKENRRSQHHIAISFGANYTIGAEGQVNSFF